MRLLRSIIVQYSETAGQWRAHFADALHVSFGSDVPMGAVRRLLDGLECPPGEYELHCDEAPVGSGVLTRLATWQPPELLFMCSHCGGKGEYVGLALVERCQACGGRGWLPE